MSLSQLVAAFAARVGHPGRKLVLLKLADNANDQGICWPSMAHIAHETELSRDSVKRHIAVLEAAGLISVRRRKKDGVYLPSVYELHIVGGRCRQHPPPAGPHGVGADSTGVGAGSTGVGAGSTDGVGAGSTSEPPMGKPSTTNTVDLDPGDEVDLRAALVARARELGKRSSSAWAGAAMRRIRGDGLDPDDVELLADWRAQQAAAAARQAERDRRDAGATTYGAAPPPESSLGRKLAAARAAQAV